MGGFLSGKYGGNFFITRFFGTFFIFSSSVNGLFLMTNLIKNFLALRQLFINNSSFSLRSIYQGIYFSDWKFYRSKNNIFFSVVSDNVIREYKLKLKNIVKISYTSSSFIFLKILNNEIYSWLLRIKNSSNFDFICSELDLYLYKILWKWAKRRHIRRSNTWIYSKYWKFILGSWKFCIFDPKAGKFVFLRSHSFVYSRSYFFPNSLNMFNIFNQKKISYISFHRFLFNLEGIYLLLWKKQYGLCFVCGKSLGVLSLINWKVVFLKSYRISYSLNDISLLVLLHKYCVCSF